MIQVQQEIQRLLRRARPGQDGFTPRHAHVVVQFTVEEERALGQIPEGIARLRAREGFPVVNGFPRVLHVLPERFPRPVRKDRDGFDIVLMQAQVERQLAPDEQFVEELGGAVRPVPGRIAGNPEG